MPNFGHYAKLFAATDGGVEKATAWHFLKLWTRRIRELEDELLRQFRSAEQARLAAEKAQAAEAAKLAAEAAAKAAEAMRGLRYVV